MTSGRGRWITCVALAIPLVGCEGALEVEDRQFLTPAALNADLLVAGAHFDFNRASGSFLTASAVLSDELYHSGTDGRLRASDMRARFPIPDGNWGDGAYIGLHRARWAAIRAFRALEDEGEGGSSDAAEMKFLEAMTYVMLGEGYCTGIPFGETKPDGTLVHGVPLSTEQVFEEAVDRFDAALAIDDRLDHARVGKARVLVDLGRYQEAASVVAGVPISTIREILHSENTDDQELGLSVLLFQGRLSMGVRPDDLDPVRGRKDPRMLYAAGGPGFDPGIFSWHPLKYSVSPSSPVTLADGIEARLIEAEADLAAGGSNWLTILNDLRAEVDDLMAERVQNYEELKALAEGEGNVEPLAPLADPGNTTGRVDLLFLERAAWMFLTGHRLGDLRRMIRQYGRVADEVFPSGAYFIGGSYGSDVALSLDFAEQDNPHWDTSMCSSTTP